MAWRHFLWSVFEEVLKAVSPIVILLLLVKFILLAVSGSPLLNEVEKTLWVILSVVVLIVGLGTFLKGLDFSLLPLGDAVGATLPKKAHLWLVALFSLILGGVAAVAEPDLKVYVKEAISALGGQVPENTLMVIIAIGTAIGLTLGILRIALKWRLVFVFLPLIIAACLLTLVCPKPLNLIALDVAPVISGSITVPLFLSLGIGIASIMGGENPGMAGFGLVSLASMGPVVAILLYGAIALQGVSAPEPVEAAASPTASAAVATDAGIVTQASSETPSETSAETAASSEGESKSLLAELLEIAIHVLSVIVPVYLFLIGFQKLILRSPINHLPAVLAGVVVIVLGLVLFFKGLEGGFKPLVKGVGAILPDTIPMAWVIVLLSSVLGIIVTFAEPSVIIFAKQIEEVTMGAINRQFLLIALGVGIAFGFGLGIVRYWLGIPLPYILLPILVIEGILTIFVLERYSLIAWDSMGVASGAITVPFFLFMGAGIASSVVPPDAVASAGLGLVMMASAGPVLSVLLIGLVAQQSHKHT